MKLDFQQGLIKIKSRFREYNAFLWQWAIKAKNQFHTYSNLKKRMILMLACMVVLFGGIFSFQMIKSLMIRKYFSAHQSPPVTVSAQRLTTEAWQPKIYASGSLEAVQGVDVTSEVAGLIRKIWFKSGDEVKAGDKLIELNAASDEAHLDSLIALAGLAEITYIRDKEQYAHNAVSKSTVDASLADFKSKEAQVAEQADILAKKTILAPFSGFLGISVINEGQYLNPGDKIVTLQHLDPMYVNFYVPQQELLKVALGNTVVVTLDCYPGKTFQGTITAIDPKVDPNTRNLSVEATLSNPNHELLPGMFAFVEVHTGEPQHYLTLPQSAISYNPYGEIVYVVSETGKDKKGNPILTATQTFVMVGETRGDQVAILKGLKAGDLVVTSGQLKLKNGSQIVINNTILPPNDAAPLPVDE